MAYKQQEYIPAVCTLHLVNGRITVGGKFRPRLTAGLVSTTKQINQQPSDQTFLSINYHPIL